MTTANQDPPALRGSVPDRSPRRKWLGERFQSLLDLAKPTGKLERMFLWGSFVTSKEAPGDLDVLIVMASSHGKRIRRDGPERLSPRVPSA